MSSYSTSAKPIVESSSKNPKTERAITPPVECVSEQAVEIEDKCEYLPFIKPPKPQVTPSDKIIEKDGFYFIIKSTNRLRDYKRLLSSSALA